MRGHSPPCSPNERGPLAQRQGNRMAVIKRIQVIDKPVEQVFETVVNVANFPKWNPTTPSARKLSPGEIGEGTRFELEIRPKGLFKIFSPFMGMIGGKNLRDTAAALQRYLERS